MALRIKLRYDTIGNWEQGSRYLLPGEVGVAKLENGLVDVRVGTDEGGTLWGEAPPITSKQELAELLDVNLLTNLSPGDILVYDSDLGKWTNKSLFSRLAGGVGGVFLSESEDGIVTINIGNATYNPSLSPTTIATIEIRGTYSANTNFMVSSGGSGDNVVKIASATLTSVANENYNTFTNIPFTITNGGGTVTLNSFTTPNNVSTFVSNFNWNNPSTGNTRTSKVQVVTTSSNVSNGGQPFTPISVPLDSRVVFAWRFAGITSATDFTNDLGSITLDGTADFNALVANPPNTTTTNQITRIWNVPSGVARYLYFIHSANGPGTSDTFGWTPKFFAPNGDEEPWVEITTSETTDCNVALSGAQYRVWKSPNVLNTGSYSINIRKSS